MSEAKIVLSAEDRTKAAFDSAVRNLGTLGSRAQSIAPALAGIFSAVGLVSFVRSTVDGIDALNDLKDATGASIETLSALERVAKLNGGTLDDVSGVLVRFNKVLNDAQTPGGEAARVIESLGLSVKELTSLDPAEALRRAAVALNGFADDGNKARGAQVLFGKSIREAAPFLKDLAEAGELNATVTTQQAEEAERLNKHLAALQTRSSEAGRALLSDLLPAINQLFDAIKGRDTGGESAITSLITVPLQTAAIVGSDVAFVMRGIGTEIGGMAAQLASLARLDFKGFSFIGAAMKEDAAQARKELDAFQARVMAIGTVRNGAAGASSPLPSLRVTPGKDPAAEAAARAAEQARAKALDNALKRLQAGLKAEKEALQDHNADLADQYQQGLLSIERYFNARGSLQADSLQRTRAALAEELRLLQDAQAKVPKDKPQEREALQGKIEEVYARQAEAARDAARATADAERERQRATTDFQRALVDLDAQLAELSGDRYGAELLRNAQVLDQARALLAKGGGDPGREDALQRRLQAQAGLNELARQYGQITERAQVNEEAFLIQSQRSGATRLEVEAGLRRLREGSLAQLDELIAANKRLAESSTDPAVIAYFQQLKLARERAFDAKDPGLTRFNELAAEGGRSIADAFGDAILAGGKLGDVFDSLTQQLARLITQQLIVIPLAEQITKLIRGSGLGSIFGVGDVLPGGVGAAPYHTGGIVGVDGGAMRALPSSLWDGAARYHRGGIAGLQPDEVPAILRRGEEVLTEADPRHRNAGRGMAGSSDAVTVNVINNGAPVKARASERETPEGTIIDVVLDAVAQDMATGGRVHDATQRRFGLSAGASLPRY